MAHTQRQHLAVYVVRIVRAPKLASRFVKQVHHQPISVLVVVGLSGVLYLLNDRVCVRFTTNHGTVSE